MPEDHAEQVALFRYRVVAEALDERLTPQERGLLVRELAARAHELPGGGRKEFSRATLDRWIRAFRERGLQGLRPQPRSDAGTVRAHPELIEEALRLRREAPARSAKQISRIILARRGLRVSPRTIGAHLARRGLDRHTLGAQVKVYGRFQADRPNEVWIGDVLHGPFVPWPRTANSRRAYLFMLLDDFSRMVLHGSWVTQEDTRAGQRVLRHAIITHGIPDVIYVDNGGPYVHAALERSCALLGVRLTHSRPGQPAGRGKVERAFRFVREAFLTEATLRKIESFQQLNDWFTAWVDRECNTRVHDETKESPAARFATLTNPRRPDSEQLYEAFRWSAVRTVTSTAMVSLNGVKYQVEPALCLRKVELHYDPDDLSRIDVWWQGRRYCSAVPFVVGRHVQHQRLPEQSPPPPPSGVSYLDVLQREHMRDLGSVNYRHLPGEEDS